ncbi:energy-coupling factor transport system permease protein [Pilibacter termitis]|uniref:Energy-coupling factor transport system permease protein n=1 Tax=Pilibacter termitis TaxID=263852 RepID=A0A1T4K5H8_9ENTE|nr:energy-coupling factor transporter transmembrane component T [Pilibacter termitis]SJZ37662.1 energy-coupling factor transport system permease protein [Pilibacter termitis]
MNNNQKIDEFSRRNPIVTLFFFVITLTMTLWILHPLGVFLSLAMAFLYLSSLQGIRKVLKKSAFLLPVVFVAILINPLFSHAGTTILWYFPNGNPLTLESILYGLYTGGMLLAVMLWFGCFHQIMTTDKFVYLFGKITPSLSLLLSMSLRFIPRFIAQLKEITVAQKSIGVEITIGNVRNRMKNMVKIVSVLITWSLENAIDTADSMKSRGYGVGKRTSFHIFEIEQRDKFCLLLLSGLLVYSILNIVMNVFYFRYFPMLQVGVFNVKSTFGWFGYGCLLGFPLLLNLQEAYVWRQKKAISK